ncbi:MAG: hypothetical protein PHS14_14580 [Elusimicrobia bacterium]|nr:hypothetical protein [Elusimicrobiota bacterium]
MTKTLVLAALCATAAYAGSAGEGEHAARLEARVEAALERMLGPGRAAATVEVRGERVTKREQSEIPGAGEETLHEGAFAVSGVRARLVLDKSLGEGAVAEAVRVTGEILALDRARGDELTVLRTSFLPSWRAAFSRPRDARDLALLCLAAAAVMLAAGLIGRAATRSAAALAEAIANRRAAAPEPPSRVPPAALPARRISPLPPLEKGGRGS